MSNDDTSSPPTKRPNLLSEASSEVEGTPSRILPAATADVEDEEDVEEIDDQYSQLSRLFCCGKLKMPSSSHRDLRKHLQR